MDLAEFLAARLGEDEAAANDERIWFGPFPEAIKESEGELIIQKERVLAEVAAKRAILARHAEAQGWSYPPGDGDEAVQDELVTVVRHLAAVYSDHPDYRQEWKP